MGKRVEYLVTPRRGRVHKSRQVQPFTVKVGERHGDIDFLEDQISFALRKWAKKTDLVTVVRTTGEASVYESTTWIGLDPKAIAVCTVEAVES